MKGIRGVYHQLEMFTIMIVQYHIFDVNSLKIVFLSPYNLLVEVYNNECLTTF